MPSFNQGKYIEEALVSIIDQQYVNLELIVMDGGSTDDSVSIIERYSKQIFHWQSKKDGGQADAIATGFDISTGDILCWLNSDDTFQPGTLMTIGRLFQKSKNIDFAYGNRYVINESSELIGRHVWLRYLNKRHWYDGMPLAQECCFWRREIYLKVGGMDPSLFFIMDRDLFYRIWSMGKYRKVNKVLGSIRIHSESKNSKFAHIREKESLAFREKYHITQPSKISRSILQRIDRMQIWIEKLLLKNDI